MIRLRDIFFASLSSVAVSCLFQRRWAPWCDIDLVCKALLQTFLRTPGWSLCERAWRESYYDRVSLFKYAVWGSVLVLILPLHALTSSTWFVDELWGVLEWVRHHIPEGATEAEIFSHAHNWRDAPYELWEVCVFLWVFPIIGNWIKHDYIKLAERSHLGPRKTVLTGQVLAISVFILSTLGAFFLVVLEAPRFRLCIELLVVGILAVADLYFCRQWLPLDRVRATGHLEVFLIVDAGAIMGFVALLVFFETSLSYGLHWSSPFVAGASALNLLFANTAALVLRGVQGYRESRPSGGLLAAEGAHTAGPA
jgi:hypothetical protein